MEQLRQPIVEFLQGQRQGQARAQLVDELRNKTANVKVMLDPPRVEVTGGGERPGPRSRDGAGDLVEFSDYQ